MRIPFCTFIFASSLAAASVPDSTAHQEPASVTITTGSDTAWVFIDSTRVGPTPCTLDSLPPGQHRLRLIHTDVTSWLAGTITDTFSLAPGEHRTFRYAFEQRVMIVTDPSGAVVYLGDSLAGTTPLALFGGGRGTSAQLTLEKHGYERTVLPLKAGPGGIIHAVLPRTWQSDPPESPLIQQRTGGKTPIRAYIAGGVTIISGAAAAYFKIKADNRNAQFLETGDPRLRNEIRSLDTAAALSLVATQVGFAFLTYFLLAD